MENSKTKVDLLPPQELRVYTIRWVILGLFVVYYTFNQVQWLQYSIIADVIVKYYGVPASAVDWTSLIFMVIYIPFIFPGSFILDKWGLRITVIVSAAGTCLGCWLKVGSVSPDRFWLGFIGQTIEALAQVFLLSMPARLAAVWFGPSQVSTACSIGVFANMLGIAVGFLIPPMLVNAADDLDTIGTGLYTLFISMGVVNTVILILIVIIFKDRPPTPPSLAQWKIENQTSQGVNYKEFFQSLKRLFFNFDFIRLLISFGLCQGVFNALATLLNQIVLRHYPGGADDAGRIGVCLVVAGMIGAIVCGYMLDKFRNFKSSIVVTYCVTLLCMIVLSFTLDEGIAIIYAVATILGFCVTGIMLIGFEFGAELTYPEPEGTSAGLLMASLQFFGIICTLLYSELSSSYDDFWSNITMCLLMAIGVLLVFFVRPNYRRQLAQQQNPQ